MGKPIAEVKDNFRFPSIIENIQWVIDNNEILEKEIQTTDLRWYQMNVLPYVTRNTNKTNGVIITFVEITARIKDLKEQEKLISDHETLLDTIAHDIKNPLTSLSLTIALLKKLPSEGEDKFSSLLQIVDNSINTMKDIVLDLTDQRKKEHQYKAEAELLSFENILEDVRLSLTDNLNRTGATITSEINASQIVFTRRKLRSILYNLVSNAIKYHEPGRKPEIFINTEKENNCVVITVKDNGIGIPAAKMDAIFTKYYRVENKIEGSGVGLYLVNEIVKNAGGKISVESKEGKGTTFKVYLKSM
jgi:two-component system, OmpR family, phosphate regulon sensor histidine kinase PhoR